MHFSTISVVLAVAGTAAASQPARRHVVQYMPRGLEIRADGCASAQFATGMTCCGASGTEFFVCPSDQSCTSKDKTTNWWCCPKEEPNCNEPKDCGTNNGGCGDQYTCDASSGTPKCTPKQMSDVTGAAGATGDDGAAGTDGSSGTSGDTTSTDTAGTSTSSDAATQSDTAGETTATTGGDSTSGESTTDTTTTTGNETATTGNETTTGGTPPPEAISGASRLSGISALALAVMAGVFFL